MAGSVAHGELGIFSVADGGCVMGYMGILRKLVPDSVTNILFRMKSENVLERIRRENRTIGLEHIIDDADELTLTCIPEQPWNMQLLEVSVLCLLVRNMNAKNVFEIGTFDGRTTINIARALPDGGKITTLDLSNSYSDGNNTGDEGGTGYRFKRRTESDRIEQLFGDSIQFRPESVGKKYDMVIVDGDHTERYVMHDTELALSLLRAKENSMIVWHDVDYSSVYRALQHVEAVFCLFYWHIACTRLAISFPFAREEMILKKGGLLCGLTDCQLGQA